MDIDIPTSPAPTLTKGLPNVIEFVGPAGVGKTTLIRALRQQPGIENGVRLRRLDYLPLLSKDAPLLLPTVVAGLLKRERFLDRERRSLGYLRAWYEALGSASVGATICFDHGPIFRLALLREFGSPATKHPLFQRWWNHMLEQWAARLTLIVWLDAPDSVLVERINARDEDHLFKGKDEAETTEFLRRFRSAYQEIIVSMTVKNNPKLLRLNTHEKPLDEAVDDLLEAFAAL